MWDIEAAYVRWRDGRDGPKDTTHTIAQRMLRMAAARPLARLVELEQGFAEREQVLRWREENVWASAEMGQLADAD